MASADPIAAAESLAGQTYAGAKDRTTAGKQALLDQLSTQGTYTNQINQASTQAAAPQPVATRPGDSDQLGGMQQQGAQQVQMANQAAIAAAATLAAHQASNQQQQAGTYFDQVGAALPLEQSRSESEARGIIQQLIQEREDRANALKLQQLQMQETQARIAAAAADREAAAAPQALSISEKLALKKDAFQTILPASQVTDPATGQKTALAEAVEQGSEMAPEAFSKYLRSSGLSSAEQQQAVDALNRYSGTLAQNGYYGGAATPQYITPGVLNNASAPGRGDPLAGTSSSKSKAKAKTTAKPKAKTPIYDSMGHITGYR